MAKNSIV